MIDIFTVSKSLNDHSVADYKVVNAAELFIMLLSTLFIDSSQRGANLTD